MPVDVQMATSCSNLPEVAKLNEWVSLTIQQKETAEVLIRLVDNEESANLNETYRQKNGPTNVLSFPFECPEGLPNDVLTNDILGDLVICAPVVECEAEQQKKLLESHWAHMVIHGCLHLQGYDHIDEPDRIKMEAIEIKLLASIGIDNPYETK